MADWIFYPYTTASGDPGSVLMDQEAARGVRPRDFRHRAVLHLDLRRPRSDGLSTPGEAKTLSAIEDEVVPLVCADGRSLFVGRTTASGRRDFYFYSGDPAALEADVRAAMARHKGYTYEIEIAEDAGWSSYFDVLRPSGEQMNFIKNRRLRDDLAKQGDDGTAPRAIEHLVKALSTEARDLFVGIVEGDGFTVLSSEAEEDGFRVEVSRVDRVDEIDTVSGPLFALCERLGATYDGWRCIAAKG